MATPQAPVATFHQNGVPLARPHYLVDQYGNPLSLALDPTFGGLSIAQFIQYHILAGRGFRATTGQVATGVANVWLAVQGVANALAVNVLIYNILVSCNASTSDVRLYNNVNSTSTDTDLTANLLTSIFNQKVGGGVASALSALNGSPAGTLQTTVSANAGNVVADMAVVGNSTLNVLSNGSLLLLPKGAQNTFGVYVIEGTSGNKVSITLEWIEF